MLLGVFRFLHKASVTCFVWGCCPILLIPFLCLEQKPGRNELFRNKVLITGSILPTFICLELWSLGLFDLTTLILISQFFSSLRIVDAFSLHNCNYNKKFSSWSFSLILPPLRKTVLLYCLTFFSLCYVQSFMCSAGKLFTILILNLNSFSF